MKHRNITAIILAAGKGNRMHSKLPKVLHALCGKPMLNYVLETLDKFKSITQQIVVVGYKHELVKQYLRNRKKVICVMQKNLLGTADAIKVCKNKISKNTNTLLVVYGDSPLLRKSTLADLLKLHIKSNSAVTLLTAKIDNPTGYGRIIRDENGNILRISEDKDLDSTQKDIKEINVGAACFNKKILFDNLNKIQSNNTQKEYYLTDVVEILSNNTHKIESLELKDTPEVQGINSYDDLQSAQKILHQRIILSHVSNGVNIIDPQSTHIDSDSEIGENTTIYPFTIIESNVKIGKYCRIGPFCRLRQFTKIENYAEVGNFIELVRTKVGVHTKAKHFGYLGDAKIGNFVNIGAGTITANFDGINKNSTIIRDNAFIGSDSVLIAPVNIGKKAITGAGSVVVAKTKIPDKTVVVGIPAKIIKNKK